MNSSLEATAPIGGAISRPGPEDYGLTLTAVYAVWIAAVAALYPLCRWFAQLKQRRSDGWLTYL
jgi:hypothetical protein